MVEKVYYAAGFSLMVEKVLKKKSRLRVSISPFTLTTGGKLTLA